MSKERSGLFGLLALAGFGGIAAAIASTASAAQRPRPTPASDVSSPTVQPYKREWKLAYQGGNPTAADVAALVANPPAYKVGQMVRFAVPAGESADISSDPIAGQTLIIKSVLCSVPTMKDATGRVSREVSPNGGLIGGQWSYTTDKGGEDRPIHQAWLVPAQADQKLVKQVASVIADATTKSPATKEASVDLPNYPQGLVVSKGAAKGKILAISKAADGYHYKLTAGMGPFSSEYQGTQDQIRDMLAKQAGQQSYGFIFPVGISLEAGKYRTAINDRKDVGGKKFYVTSEGEVSEPALVLKLYQGLKG
jgi:hypothetical protein